MFFGLILGLSGYFHTREDGKAITDDIPFRLHYGFTSGILFLSTALVGLQDFVGKNIDCHSTEFSHQAINQYCWITGTHLMAKSSDPRGLGKSVYYNDEKCTKVGDKFQNSNGDDCIVTHSYYQWIPYVLLLQACLFYIPRLFWIKNEEGKITTISDGVRAGTVVKCDDSDDKIRNVAKNVADYIRLQQAGHFKYGMCYLLAQIWNGINLAFVFWFTNKFLEGRFALLGYDWFQALLDPNVDSNLVLYQIFPRVTKCSFETYGKAGGRTFQDYLCVLAPNIISEKIFTFLWFWYLTLAAITAINIFLVISMAIKSSRVRKFYLTKVAWTRKLKNSCQADCLNEKICQLNFGQFLFIYLLGRNVNYSVYKRILLALCESSGPNCQSLLHMQPPVTAPPAPSIEENGLPISDDHMMGPISLPAYYRGCRSGHGSRPDSDDDYLLMTKTEAQITRSRSSSNSINKMDENEL